jgi:hypothetical protein
LSDQYWRCPKPKQSALTAGRSESRGSPGRSSKARRNPYYNLIVIYVFAPYFAKELAGGGEHGLSLSGLTVTLAGIATALTAPFLGVIADKAGRRKPPDRLLHDGHVHLFVQSVVGAPGRPADNVADHGRAGGRLLLLRFTPKFCIMRCCRMRAAERLAVHFRPGPFA